MAIERFRPNLTREQHLQQMVNLEPWVDAIITDTQSKETLQALILDFQRKAYEGLGVCSQSIDVQEERIKNVFKANNAQPLEITAQIANVVHTTRVLNPSASEAIDGFVNERINQGSNTEDIMRSGNASHEIKVADVSRD